MLYPKVNPADVLTIKSSDKNAIHSGFCECHSQANHSPYNEMSM